MGLSPKLKADKLMGAVQQWMEDQQNYLVVIDSANDLDILKPSPHGVEDNDGARIISLLRFIPKGPFGTILWTSQDHDIVGRLVSDQQGIHIGPMERTEAITLFKTREFPVNSIQPSLSDTEDLIHYLHRIPLAIAQAASYLTEEPLSVAEHICELREVSDWIIDVDINHQSQSLNTVLQTSHASTKQIAMQSRLVENILHTVAYLDKSVSSELLGAIAGPAVSPHELLTALNLLMRFSLMQSCTTVHTLASFELHSSIQRAARRALATETRREEQVHSARLAFEAIHNLFPEYRGQDGYCDIYERYMPHSVERCSCQSQ